MSIEFTVEFLESLNVFISIWGVIGGFVLIGFFTWIGTRIAKWWIKFSEKSEKRRFEKQMKEFREECDKKR